MKFQYIFSAIARWQVFSYYSDILLQWTSITFALSYHDTTLLCWTTYASETVGLSQTQEHAVLKDAELLPLVLAARRGYQRRHRHRQPPGATAVASRWAVAAGPSRVPPALSLRCYPPPPPTPPARPQPIIRIIGQELTQFQPLCSRNRRLWHSWWLPCPSEILCGDLQRKNWARMLLRNAQ